MYKMNVVFIERRLVFIRRKISAEGVLAAVAQNGKRGVRCETPPGADFPPDEYKSSLNEYNVHLYIK